MKTTIVSVFFNPWMKWIWTERLPLIPHAGPQGYEKGRCIQQHRMTMKNCLKLYKLCAAAGFKWSQDGNGTHMRRDGF